VGWVKTAQLPLSAAPPYTSTMASLADLILPRYVKGVFDSPPQDFLPQNHITELITKDAIIEELADEDGDLDNDEDKELVDFIHSSAKRVFATTIVSGLGSSELYKAMRKFKVHNFQDESLPLKENAIPNLQCFPAKPWSKVRTYNFLRFQWIFLAPVFSTSKFQLDLEPEHIFPFTWVSDVAKEGAFSNVYEVTIHDKHQEDPAYTVRPHF
jgi:hypothetical protein